MSYGVYLSPLSDGWAAAKQVSSSFVSYLTLSGTQYHPEFQSRPLEPSPPFYGLIMAAGNQLGHVSQAYRVYIYVYISYERLFSIDLPVKRRITAYISASLLAAIGLTATEFYPSLIFQCYGPYPTDSSSLRMVGVSAPRAT
jgi:hypothetical protein